MNDEDEKQFHINWLWINVLVMAIGMNLHSCRMTKIEKSLKALETAHSAEETK